MGLRSLSPPNFRSLNFNCMMTCFVEARLRAMDGGCLVLLTVWRGGGVQFGG